MGAYRHKKEYELRYSDLDFEDKLKPSSLLALTQEAACLSADELGFGYEALKPLGLAFIIVNTYCELVEPVEIGEILTVETWPLPPRHVIFERDYRVTGKRGVIANIASRWCLVDLKEFSLRTPEQLGEVHARCPYRDEKTVEVPSWKIPKLGDRGNEVFRMRVGSSRCDHYFHANNTYYADFFMDCFTMDELSKRKMKSFQIAYVKQAKAGSELTFFRMDEADATVLEARLGGELIAQFRAVFA